MRVPVAAASLLALVVTLSGASAHAAPLPASASARSLAVRVVYPDGKEDVLAEAVAPPARQVTSGGLNYGDGVVTTGAVWSRARALSDVRADSWGSSTVRAVSLFGGEITIGAVSTKATASASAKGAQGGLSGSWLAEVEILGEQVRATSNARVQLGDWGYAVLLEQAVVRDRTADRAADARHRHPRLPDEGARRAARRDGDPRRLRRGSRERAAPQAGPDGCARRPARERFADHAAEGPEARPRAAVAERAAEQAPARSPQPARQRPPAAHGRPLRVPGVRPVLVLERLRRVARDHGLAPRQRHLRAATARPSSRSRTARSSSPAGTTSAGTASGYATERATSSTSRTSPRSRRSRSPGRRCARAT